MTYTIFQGPVGLAAGLASTLYSPRSITFLDLSDSRLELAKRMIPGAHTHTINTKGANPASIRGKASTSNLFDADIDGFDVVMEAVGIPATFDVCQELVGKGGTIANIGVHGHEVKLAIDRLWPRGTSEFFLSPSLSGFLLRFWGLWILQVSDKLADHAQTNSALHGPRKHAHHPSNPGPAGRRQIGDGGVDGYARYVLPHDPLHKTF